MFRRGIAYWQRPLLTAGYFLCATITALLVFSTAPLQLVLASSTYGVESLILLYFVLLSLALYGFFTYDGGTISKNNDARNESLRYVFAKSADILFQDTLAVIVILSLQALLKDITLAIVLFSAYFFLSHLLLLLILPVRFASIFAVAAFFAGFAFASIVLYDLGVIYVFILHWMFYAASYSIIKKVRKKTIDKLSI